MIRVDLKMINNLSIWVGMRFVFEIILFAVYAVFALCVCVCGFSLSLPA